MSNNKGFGLMEVLIAMVLAASLAMFAFKLIVMLNVAIIKADKAVARLSSSAQSIVCTQVENGASGVYKCVANIKLKE